MIQSSREVIEERAHRGFFQVVFQGKTLDDLAQKIFFKRFVSVPRFVTLSMDKDARCMCELYADLVRRNQREADESRKQLHQIWATSNNFRW